VEHQKYNVILIDAFRYFRLRKLLFLCVQSTQEGRSVQTEGKELVTLLYFVCQGLKMLSTNLLQVITYFRSYFCCVNNILLAINY
jgi:hypothetical protein